MCIWHKYGQFLFCLILYSPEPDGGVICAKSGGGVVTDPSEPHCNTLQCVSEGSGCKVHWVGTFCYVSVGSNILTSTK